MTAQKSIIFVVGDDDYNETLRLALDDFIRRSGQLRARLEEIGTSPLSSERANEFAALVGQFAMLVEWFFSIATRKGSLALPHSIPVKPSSVYISLN